MAQGRVQGGFFERMLGPLPGVASAHPPRWVGDPVRDHLMLLLNTRRGSVPHLPGYGLPDVSEFYQDYPGSLAELRRLVEQLIDRYETRLVNVQVRLLESDSTEFRASFLISGDLEVDDQPVRVTYRTTINNTGRAALEGTGPD
ncbi:MAG TPA: type VI secretion system baseplate subunit TssE [Thermoanaerobaculaceae bacterium]|nr:type VI secretion system baseplate subunit TssE [Thermoanaerobaculaceae bacterium]